MTRRIGGNSGDTGVGHIAYKLTDVGNAQRLVATHGRDIRWVARWKAWFVWDGRRWASDERGEVERRAKECVRNLFAEAATLDGEKRTALALHAVKSEQANRIDAMIRMARSEPGVCISHDEFDDRPWHLTVRNGTVDLRTGALGPHDRLHLSTKIVDVDYDPDATCSVWRATLDTLFASNQPLIDYLQRAIGYSMSGSTREQVLHLCYGTGANGKSTVFDVLARLSGDYGLQADFSTFLDTGTNRGPTSDVARLAGARLVRSIEIGENKKLNEGLIKSLTGSDIVTARFLYSLEFEYKPQFKLWLAANHKPVIRGTDYAIWRRIRLIPFEVTITPEQRDETLPGRLHDELSGILTWAIIGCQLWLLGGLQPPESVLTATEDYRSESDVIGAFLEDECDADHQYECSVSSLYSAYVRWSKDNGEYCMTATAFGRRLTERGHVVRKSNGVKLRGGLRLAHDRATQSSANQSYGGHS